MSFKINKDQRFDSVETFSLKSNNFLNTNVLANNTIVADRTIRASDVGKIFIVDGNVTVTLPDINSDVNGSIIFTVSAGGSPVFVFPECFVYIVAGDGTNVIGNATGVTINGLSSFGHFLTWYIIPTNLASSLLDYNKQYKIILYVSALAGVTVV